VNEFGDLGTIALAAIAMHELFSSFVDAGFSEDQALALVLETLRGAQRPQN
jgi:hypothetical protein